MNAHARTIMTKDVVSATCETTLREAAETLVSRSMGGLPVVDGNQQVVGYLSESDLVRGLLRGSASETTVAKLMTSPARVVDEFASLRDVMLMMRESAHHLPVTREGQLIGIIAPHDVLKHYVDHEFAIPPLTA